MRPSQASTLLRRTHFVMLPRCALSSHAASSRRMLSSSSSSSEKVAASPPGFFDDDRIRVDDPHYNRRQQLVPACIAGIGIGTYASVPAVLGPFVCRAQGVVAQAPSDFQMSELLPLATAMPLVAGILAATLAGKSEAIGHRRLAFMCSAIYPLGVYGLSALAVQSASLPLFGASYALLGGFGSRDRRSRLGFGVGRSPRLPLLAGRFGRECSVERIDFRCRLDRARDAPRNFGSRKVTSCDTLDVHRRASLVQRSGSVLPTDCEPLWIGDGGEVGVRGNNLIRFQI